MARILKARKAKEEALKEAGIDPTNVNLDAIEEEPDIDSKFNFRANRREDIKRFVIYPDGRFKQDWEKVMSL